MADWNPKVNELFAKVIELESPQEQRALLDSACGEDSDLRAGVERLLRAHNDAGSFLNKPPDGLAPTITTGDHDTVDESDTNFSLDFLTPTDKSNCLGTLGQYEAIEVVGRGGMGLVLRTYDTKLNRVVAIKAMAPELAANPMAVKRFLREARAAAAVSHEHVVTIHAIEEDNKPPFIVMEFVDGKSLQEKVDEEGALELKEILRIGMQTARGLAAAHEQGLVHRDIKPANILLENGIERVQLTDFGLARATDDVSVTQTGQIAGTPQYMSPEQAEGKQLDARSDLFSLGSVLYTMCTGRPPFRAHTAVAMLRRVTEDEPRPICELNDQVPKWLEAIIAKLLAKNASERIQSAEEVASLLGQHLAHVQDPQTAPMPRRIERPAKTATWGLNDLFLWIALPIVLCFALVIKPLHRYLTAPSGGTVIVQSDDESVVVRFSHILNETSEGSRERVALVPSETVEHRGSGVVDLPSGRFSVSIGKRSDEFRASQSFFTLGDGHEVTINISRRPVPKSDFPDTQTAPPQNLTPERILAGRTGSVVSGSPIAAAGNGRRLISADGADKTATLWDVETGQVIFTMPMDGDLPESVAISHDGKWAAVRGEQGHIDLWNLTERKRFHRLDQTENRGSAMTFSADERFLVTGALKNGKSKGQAIVWDVQSGQRRRTDTFGDGSIAFCTAIPGTSDVILSERQFWRWNLETGEITTLPDFPATMELGVNVSSDGSRAVVVGVEKNGLQPISGTYSVEVRDLKTGELVSRLETGESIANAPGAFDWPACVCFLGKDGFVAAGYMGGGVRVWDVASGREVAHFRNVGSISHVVSLGDGLLASFTGKGPGEPNRHDIEILRLTESEPERRLNGVTEVRRFPVEDAGLAIAVDVSPRMDRLAVGCLGGNVSVFDLYTGTELRCSGITQTVECLSFSSDGLSLFTGSSDSTVRKWNPETGTEIGRFIGHTGWVSSIAASPGGKYIATGSRWYEHEHGKSTPDNSVRLWTTETQEEARALEGVSDPIYQVRFSEDGQFLAAGGEGKQLIVWNVEGGEIVHRLTPRRNVVSLAISADGGLLAYSEVGYSGNQRLAPQIVIIDLNSEQELSRLSGHESRISGLEFTSDGRHLISVSGPPLHRREAQSDNSIRIWEVESGKQTAKAELDTPIHCMALMPDGRQLVSVGGLKGSNDVRLWQLPESVRARTSPTQELAQDKLGILTNPPTVPKGGLLTGTNLITDSSLENTLLGELPKTWTTWLDDSPNFQCEVVEGGVTGEHCLQISGSGKRGVVFATSIPMDRTKRYTLKGHVRVEGDDRTWAVIKFNYFNKTGWLGVDDRVGVKSGETGWKFFEKTDRANAFPEATLMVPTCHIEGNGTAWFDDLKVIAWDRDKIADDFDTEHGKNNRKYSLD